MTATEKASGWHLIFPAIVLLVAALFLYSLIPVLAPFITFLILLLLLSPYAGTREHRVLVLALGLMIVFWLLRTLGALLAPFVLALVVAYILDPIVDRIEERVRRRPLAVALLVVPLVAVVGVGAAFRDSCLDRPGRLSDRQRARSRREGCGLAGQRTRAPATAARFAR